LPRWPWPVIRRTPLRHVSGRLQLRLWGVRGSIPTPAAQNLGYGGNTACVEIRLSNNDLFIFDAGTGIRELGLALHSQAGMPRHIHILFSHFHWDHIQGLPFFGPLYDSNCSITFYSTCYTGPLRESLAAQMAGPYFPVNFEAASAKKNFVELGEAPLAVGDLTIRTFPMNHPQGAGGYRIESSGASVVYAPDREHGHEELDARLRECARDADILIHDAQYTPEEYQRFQGWGHSTWQEAVSVARESKAKQLVLFHHDPSHDDAAVSAIEENARACFANTIAAREGWTASL
jgi:phosphoribosyl 1,2-cyclic phosphodiesterase